MGFWSEGASGKILASKGHLCLRNPADVFSINGLQLMRPLELGLGHPEKFWRLPFLKEAKGLRFRFRYFYPMVSAGDRSDEFCLFAIRECLVAGRIGSNRH